MTAETETWRELDEVKAGERRSWFSGTDERKRRPWYERWCGSILKVGRSFGRMLPFTLFLCGLVNCLCDILWMSPFYQARFLATSHSSWTEIGDMRKGMRFVANLQAVLI